MRCCGGYVVTVGAVHQSGHVYVWKDGCRPDQAPIAEMPSWLIERLTIQRSHAPVRPSGLHTGYASAALASEEMQLLQTPIGNRNARLNLAAFRLARFISSGALGPVANAVPRQLATRAAAAITKVAFTNARVTGCGARPSVLNWASGRCCTERRAKRSRRSWCQHSMT